LNLPSHPKKIPGYATVFGYHSWELIMAAFVTPIPATGIICTFGHSVQDVSDLWFGVYKVKDFLRKRQSRDTGEWEC
jgi:hypothetical protein